MYCAFTISVTCAEFPLPDCGEKDEMSKKTYENFYGHENGDIYVGLTLKLDLSP